MTVDLPGLTHVERLALRQPLDDVGQDNVAHSGLGEAERGGRADVSGSYDSNLGTRHGLAPQEKVIR